MKGLRISAVLFVVSLRRANAAGSSFALLHRISAVFLFLSVPHIPQRFIVHPFLPTGCHRIFAFLRRAFALASKQLSVPLRARIRYSPCVCKKAGRDTLVTIKKFMELV